MPTQWNYAISKEPTKFYAIRIGNKTGQSADKIEDQRGRDGRLLTAPPRLNGLGMKCQSVRIYVSALIWDYKVENDDDSADGIDDDDSSEGTNKCVTSGNESKATIKKVKSDNCELRVKIKII